MPNLLRLILATNCGRFFDTVLLYMVFVKCSVPLNRSLAKDLQLPILTAQAIVAQCDDAFLLLNDGKCAQAQPKNSANSSREKRHAKKKKQQYDRYSRNNKNTSEQQQLQQQRKRQQATALSDAATRSEFELEQRSSMGTISAFNQEKVPLIRLTRDILAPHRYDVRARPVADHRATLVIHVSMSLYQIIEVNEPSQNVKMNVWMIQKWRDESLNWDPREYGMINTTILPHSVLWVPDTYLYNSVVMSADETERYMNIRADSLFWDDQRGSNMSFLYPAIYTVTCRLNIRYFPYDQQNCTLTIGSWTNSKSSVDYVADDHVNMASFIQNEEWDVMSFRIFRHEYKYACCPEPWVILEASVILRRKPLYYVINLIIPTSIITLVAVTGFFTPASTADDRTEKINLGITTLLAMSILMLMISDAMPTTSEFVPLIAWFYLSIIIIVSIGTFLTSVILGIQSRRQYGVLPPLCVRYWIMVRIRDLLCLRPPPQLALIWEELNDDPYTTYHERFRKKQKTKKYNKQTAIVADKNNNNLDADAIIEDNVITLCGDSARAQPPEWKPSRKYRPAQIRYTCAEGSFSETPLVEDRRASCLSANERVVQLSSSKRRQLHKPKRARQNWRRITSAIIEQQRRARSQELVRLDESIRGFYARNQRLSVPIIDMTSPCVSPPLPSTPHIASNLLTPGLPLDQTSLRNTSFFSELAPPSIPRRALGKSTELSVTLSPPPPEPNARVSPMTPIKSASVVVIPPRQSVSSHETAARIMPRSRQDSSWETAVMALGLTAPRKSGDYAAPALSQEVIEMRQRRQCSLEWEFIATILDRVFLILFTFTVLSVTTALMVTGLVAQSHYQSG